MSAFSPENDGDIRQLSRAIGYSRDRLRVFRENRLTVIRNYVGTHYSNNGASDKVPINLLELALNIYLQRLVANSPAVSITTDIPKLKEVCTRFELAGNHLIKEISLGKTLEMSVIGAMFSIGIVKIGLNESKIEIGGVTHDAGQVFVDNVSLDDWFHDMTVDDIENVQYEGNFYTLTIDEAEALFKGKEDKLVKLSEQTPAEDKVHSISEGSAPQREEFRPTVRLLDVYLPKFNLVLRCQASDDDADPIQDVLKVVEWTGPENGPYRKLGFAAIENNTMPIAPAMHWQDLHTLANDIFVKLGRQANRQKTFTAVPRGSEKDGDTVVDVNDGEVRAFDNPNSCKEMSTGGINQQSLGFLLVVKDLYNMLGGNLDMLGGLGPQSDTVGQDQLLSVSANMRVQRMQKKTTEFTEGIIKDVMYYLWNDPYTEIPLVKRVKGFEDIAVPVTFGPEDRENDFAEYNIKIEPYSMQHQTPENKLQGLRTIFSEFVFPSLQQMQAQGITLDYEMLFRKIGKLANITELNDIITYSNPVHVPEAVGESSKSPVTKRTYERVNRPGATNSGKAQILEQALFGGKPQNSEIASLTRATS